jgi:hypothetical protein
MNRLQAELHRLFLPQPCAPSGVEASPPGLIGPDGDVRALVIELKRPPSWEALGAVWQGVQAELDLPAPAIAVSGTDALQLWFSLAEPVAAGRAHEFLDRLRLRYLAEVEPRRVRLLPSLEVSAPLEERHAALVPALQESTGNWSAFLAPDLAPVFADTPWLDTPPNEEGQAALLRSLVPMQPPDFEAAWNRLAPRPPLGTLALDNASHPEEALAWVQPGTRDETPRDFLLRVMNDETVALPLRIEAAKALLMQPVDPQTGA